MSSVHSPLNSIKIQIHLNAILAITQLVKRHLILYQLNVQQPRHLHHHCQRQFRMCPPILKQHLKPHITIVRQLLTRTTYLKRSTQLNRPTFLHQIETVRLNTFAIHHLNNKHHLRWDCALLYNIFIFALKLIIKFCFVFVFKATTSKEQSQKFSHVTTPPPLCNASNSNVNIKQPSTPPEEGEDQHEHKTFSASKSRSSSSSSTNSSKSASSFKYKI